MSLIKSALELALEKTEGLSVDKDELKRKEVFNQGRVAAAKALDEGVAKLEEVLKTQEKELKKDLLNSWKEGAVESLLSRITLSADPTTLTELNRTAELLDALTKRKATARLQKIGGLLQQYGQELQQLKDAIAQKLGPALRQRAQQAGANLAKYVMEKDPAYLKVLAENLEAMRAEYQQALDQLKDEIRKTAD